MFDINDGFKTSVLNVTVTKEVQIRGIGKELICTWGDLFERLSPEEKQLYKKV